ncbi:MAG: DUF3048 domain-containing protein [Actinobacteria bacterium]|nr:DUF3048 domain-containing protein [Actinomycetota bacterium]MCA1719798.1 DUF3048 domain-containing protein [Actinomycetota bacterium]
MSRRLLAAVTCGAVVAGCAASSVQDAPLVVAAPVRPSPVELSPQPVAPAPVSLRKSLNPLTGLAPGRAPLVVIKVDNATTARPFQRGLGHASVVYQELTESGTTRFAAVYDGSWSGEVGPIRSARETDIELLAQYGRVTLAFSGANAGVMASVKRAERRGQLREVSHESVPRVYNEGPRRRDSYQFFSTPNQLRAARPGVRAKDIGFSFAPLPKGAGRTATGVTIDFSSYVTVVVRYNKRTGRYAVFQDGRVLQGVAPANVIVQKVTVRGSRYVDVLGSRTPYTVTTGSGPAVLLRNGRLVRATWRRLTTRTGTRFLDDKGRDVPMKPGPTWILLQPKGERLTWS